MALNRIIIDTDPGMHFLRIHIIVLKKSNASTGVDDILALMLALAAKPEELEILLISVTYGNVEVQRYSIMPNILHIFVDLH